VSYKSAPSKDMKYCTSEALIAYCIRTTLEAAQSNVLRFSNTLDNLCIRKQLSYLSLIVDDVV